MNTGLNFTIKIDFKGGNEVEKLFSELKKERKISVAVDDQKINASLNKIKFSFKSVASQIMSFSGQIGLAISGIQQSFGLLQGAVNSFVAPADEFDKLKTRLVNLYQDTDKAAQVFDNFKEIAATTPFDLLSVSKAGVQLKSFGLDAEETTKMCADLAAFMGVDVVEAASAMGRAFAGGAGAADILRERGVLALIKSFKGIEDTSKLTLPEFRKAMFETFEAPTAGIAGATDRLSKTYTGAVSNMKDAVTNFKAEVGSRLLPILKDGAIAAGDFFRSLTENPLEKTIRELKELGASAKNIWELQKFAMQQRLIEVNAELDRSNFAYDKIENVTKRIKQITAESLDLKLKESKFLTNSKQSNEDLIKIWLSLGLSVEDTNQKVKEYNQSIKAGNFLVANTVVLNAIKKRQKALKTETNAILEQKDLLIERNTLEKKINQELNQTKKLKQDIAKEEVTNKKEESKIDLIKQVFEEELAILMLKKQRNENVTEAIQNKWGSLLAYLANAYGIDSIEYQQALTKKFNFNKQILDEISSNEKKAAAEKQAIEKASFEFENRILNDSNPMEARLERQKRSLIKHFDSKRNMLIQAGYTEQEIEKQKTLAITNFEKKALNTRMKHHAKTLGSIGNNMAAFGKKGFEIGKALNIAQVLMEAPATAMTAYKSTAAIPVIGPVLAPIAMAASLATSARAIQQIKNAKPPKYEIGGRVVGASHANGGVTINMEGDEYVTNKQRVSELGVDFFDFVNFAPLSSVKQAFAGVNIPSLPSIPSPSAVMANGGSVSRVSGSDFGQILQEVKLEIIELKNELVAKQLTVNNYVSADEVVQKASSTLIAEKNVQGTIIKSEF